jgi:HD-like signal output (HDOD) protein
VRKIRSEISAAELESLYAHLDGKLDRVGLETQPEVAVRILDLVNKPDAQLQDYARIIKNDVSLTGRLLRLANSALFAQISPVTSLDRACVLLGVERLRAFSLGFYLSRAAASDAGHQLSRRIWGESVFRACFATSLAKRLCPEHGVEAFLIGLMLDSGVPLMHKLLGKAFLDLEAEGSPPAKRFQREFHTLPFTHIDLIATLARRWKLPPLLMKPLMWHHTPPADALSNDPEAVLRRIAFYVGTLDLDRRTLLPRESAPMPALASRVLGCDEKQLASLVSSATSEYKNTMSLFSGMADAMNDLDHLPDLVHVQLARVLDETLTRSAITTPRSVAGAVQRFRLGACHIELTPDHPGATTAFLVTPTGERIASCRVAGTSNLVQQIRSAFSIDPDPTDDTPLLEDHLRKLAA